MNEPQSVIIFGGSGFIGTHLSKYLIKNGLAKKVYSVDIAKPKYFDDKIEHINYDIRQPINIDVENVNTIYNFAAIHTTPGHEDHEYFETNISGAENICDFARKKNINCIVFTSSISIYGPTEDLKKEENMPQPKIPYGSSKIIAEYIHKNWYVENKDRKLSIVRPGVVFGSNENGNYTRLYHSLKNRYFFYPGRKDTQKACIYVKDLVRALYKMSISENQFELFNMCYPKSPEIGAIVKAITQSTGMSRHPLVIPGWFLKIGASFFYLISKIIRKKIGIHPDRVTKLMISTNIDGSKLENSSFAIKFSLEEAIKDWFLECEQKGLL